MPSNTPLLLETIKIEEGQILNLTKHQERCTKSRLALLNCVDILSLEAMINPPQNGVWKCRILYAHDVYSVEYSPYEAKDINTIKIVETSYAYDYKYADRSFFDTLTNLHEDADEVLLQIDGYISDTTIANIAFFNGTEWLTPKKPLLQGCIRARLLEEGFLKTSNIKSSDLEGFTQVALMNAMIGFEIINKVQIEDLEGKNYDY